MSNNADLKLDQGTSFEYTWYLQTSAGEPFNLTGFDARMQVRRTYGSTSTLLSCTLGNKLSFPSPVDGSIVLSVAPSDTSGIAFNDIDDDVLEAVYDLEIVSQSGKVSRPARGAFVLAREVTR